MQSRRSIIDAASASSPGRGCASQLGGLQRRRHQRSPDPIRMATPTASMAGEAYDVQSAGGTAWTGAEDVSPFAVGGAFSAPGAVVFVFFVVSMTITPGPGVGRNIAAG